MKHGFDRVSITPRRAALCALIALLAAGVWAGCGGGGDEAAETPKKALVPGALDDTTYAPVDTTAWHQMGTVPAVGELSADRAEEPALDEAVPPTSDRPAAPAARPDPTPVAAGSEGYVLQLGSFRNLANARQQADRIRGLGHDPVLETSTLGGETFHRVVLRGLADRSQASSLGERIHRELGITYLVRRAD